MNDGLAHIATDFDAATVLPTTRPPAHDTGGNAFAQVAIRTANQRDLSVHREAMTTPERLPPEYESGCRR